MREDDILSKTEAGREEIERRTRKLPTVLRSLLLVVDGQRDVAQLRAVATGLHGPPDALEQLVGLGLIGVGGQASVSAPVRAAAPVAATPAAPVSLPGVGDASSRYGVLYALMSDAVREQLGLRGYFLQLKIERSADLAELAQLLPDLRAAVAKARDVALADELDRRLRMAAQL